MSNDNVTVDPLIVHQHEPKNTTTNKGPRGKPLPEMPLGMARLPKMRVKPYALTAAGVEFWAIDAVNKRMAAALKRKKAKLGLIEG